MADTDGSQINSPISGNRTSERPLKRMKLSWMNQEYQFAVNPEDYTQSEPNKATITQTKGGAWIDAWGGGIKELTIKGTTGVYGRHGNTVSDPDAGYKRWKNLRNMIQNVYDDVRDGEKVELMKFYNYTDNEYFYVYPAQGGIELYRSKARPNIYQYTLHLWAVRRLGEPEKERQALGDPGKAFREKKQEELETAADILQGIHSGSNNIGQYVEYIKTHPSALDATKEKS